MQIKDPKFKEGQKVRDIEYGDIYTVVEINRYSFSGNEYWYELETDRKKYTCTSPESKLEPYTEKHKSVWDLKEREECYSLTICGNVHHGFWDGSSSSIAIRELGEIFLTKEEAFADLERRKIEAEMLRLGGRRNFKFNGENYFIYYNDGISVKGINVGFYHSTMHQGLIYFDSKEQLNEVVKTIGSDRIKKYIFGVNE